MLIGIVSCLLPVWAGWLFVVCFGWIVLFWVLIGFHDVLVISEFVFVF